MGLDNIFQSEVNKMSLKDDIIKLYREGKELDEIIVCLNTTYKIVRQALFDFKQMNYKGRIFLDEFKEVVYDRHKNGISKRKIANELEISQNTVRNFIRKIDGEEPTLDMYEKIEGNFDKSKCPLCNSTNVNNVDENIIYCMDCGNEFEFYNGYVLKVKWEYID